MNSTWKIAIALLLAIGLTVLAVSDGHSEGLLGGFLNDITGTDIGSQLADWNARNGNVVDHAAAAATDYFVPGAGRAMEGYYTYNREGLGGLIEEQLRDDADEEDDDQ